jgi:hypothetical protein
MDRFEVNTLRRERLVLEGRLRNHQAALAALEERAAPLHVRRLARRSLANLELALLDNRCRRAGLPMPPRPERPTPRERSAVSGGVWVR